MRKAVTNHLLVSLLLPALCSHAAAQSPPPNALVGYGAEDAKDLAAMFQAIASLVKVTS
jgi:hypothetical protein